jgi:hypothetical protein
MVIGMSALALPIKYPAEHTKKSSKPKIKHLFMISSLISDYLFWVSFYFVFTDRKKITGQRKNCL